ncbi:STAS domain-containing protein [Pseudomarimonas salicorniae]|uniref:STAS domain-containing protein n=1 Tax=Pseudomarimonas salicorniae TaxID=2933270 RepID=A0ABT0GDJ2_9GAMM|nr:STAS domain-containing protein [Lysobacter sp. CAU 1642]MCK7592095.1 STAS domain-containing protein [Lysobacter sp. CAU 1642]
MAVDIQRERVGGVSVASISGRLDNESAADFELFAQETVAGGERHLILDLSQLGYISNAGARVLATLSKSMGTPTTSLRVAGVQPNVRQILDAAGVSILLDLRASREAALADHPAAQGDSLGKHVLAILGVQPEPVGETDKKIVKLTELAFDLLTGQQHHNRAAKAIAQGTQVMRRITPADAAAAGKAQPAPAQRAAAPAKKLPWWKRLFGIKG